MRTALVADLAHLTGQHHFYLPLVITLDGVCLAKSPIRLILTCLNKSEERRSRRGEDRDRHDERGSGRYEERSSRYDDRDRERDRGDRDRDRDRDRRSSRYEDRERDGDRNRDRDRGRDRDRDRDRFARRDDTANSGGGRRRGGGGGFGGGGGGGYGGGNPADGGVFGSPNIRRSPTPEGTIPISKRPRKYTAWDVKAPGYENMSAMEAKISGQSSLPSRYMASILTRVMSPLPSTRDRFVYATGSN